MWILYEITRQEILLLWRKPSKLISNFLFFFIFITAFFLVAQNQSIPKLIQEAELFKKYKTIANAPIYSARSNSKLPKFDRRSNLIKYNQNSEALLITATLISLLASILSFNSEFLRKDFDDGTIEQLIISCPNLEIAVAAKMLANWLSSCFGIILGAGILSLAYETGLIFSLKLVGVMFFISLALSFVCGFCGSISMLCNSNSIIAIIAIPIIIPVLLIGHLAISADFIFNIKILVALTVFLGAISTISTAKIIKLANE